MQCHFIQKTSAKPSCHLFSCVLTSWCYNKQSSAKQADVCAESHHVITPAGGGFVPNQNRCVCLQRRVFVGLGYPYCCWYVCWCVRVSICLCVCFPLFQYKCVWSIVSVYGLSAMIRVTCLCCGCIYSLLSLSVTHHKSDHQMFTSWPDLKTCNPSMNQDIDAWQDRPVLT